MGEDDLRASTLSGLGWKFASRFLARGLQFVVGILLARQLMPEAFGLFGMIMVFVGFSEIVLELGLIKAIIQLPDLTESHRSSAFWVVLAGGAVFTLLFALLDPLVATFFETARLAGLVRITALVFLIDGLVMVHRALFERNLYFRSIAWIEVSSVLFAGVVAVSMALSGIGVMSLVANFLLKNLLEVPGYWLSSDWTPELNFDQSALRELFDVGVGDLGFSSLNYWIRKGDDLLIGRYVGAESLGNYTRAYAMMLLPVQEITRVAGRVMKPTLSRIQDDLPRVKSVFLKANRLIGLITVPALLGLMVTAEPVIVVVLGKQWTGAIPILRVLCLAGVVQSVVGTCGWLFVALGKMDQMFQWGVVSGIVILASFVAGLPWGAYGLAVAYTVATYLLMFPNVYWVGQFIDMPVREYLWNLSGVFPCGVLMATTVYSLEYWVGSWSYLNRLLVEIPAGVVVYLLLVWLFQLKAVGEASEVLSEKLSL